jgi:hypothetical protein
MKLSDLAKRRARRQPSNNNVARPPLVVCGFFTNILRLFCSIAGVLQLRRLRSEPQPASYISGSTIFCYLASHLRGFWSARPIAGVRNPASRSCSFATQLQALPWADARNTRDLLRLCPPTERFDSRSSAGAPKPSAALAREAGSSA